MPSWVSGTRSWLWDACPRPWGMRSGCLDMPSRILGMRSRSRVVPPRLSERRARQLAAQHKACDGLNYFSRII